MGAIGAGVAESLARAGFDLRVFDVREQAVASWADRATVLASAADAADADTVVIAVVSDAQVLDVVSALVHGATRCSTVVVLSTISISTVRVLDERLAVSGIDLLDCGVSGGGHAAAAGRIAAMVGGAPHVYERCRTVLETFGDPVVYMGLSGAGLAAKLARNVIHYGTRLAAYEGQLLAYRAGVDLRKLAEVVRASDERIGGTVSFFSGERPHELPDDADEEFVARQLARIAVAHKDLQAARELAAEVGVDLPLSALTAERYERVLGMGNGDDGAPVRPG